MSSTELQIGMIALAIGVLALFVVGFRWQARSAWLRWSLAAIAAALCAASPALTGRLGIARVGSRPDVAHTLLLAIGITAALATLMLLSARTRRAARADSVAPEAGAGLVSYPIDADALDVDAPEPSSTPSNHDTGDATRSAADSFADPLDLAETQRQFGALRQRARNIDLPADAPWLRQEAGAQQFESLPPVPIEARDTDGELIEAPRHDAARPATSVSADEVADALLLEDDSPTGEPIGGDPDVGGAPRPLAHAVQTLAPNSARNAAPSTAPPDALIRSGSAGAPDRLAAVRRLRHAERLARQEREARRDAEGLVSEQARLIDTLRDDLRRVNLQAADLRTRLSHHERELSRARNTARDATRVARAAATVRRDLERRLAQERAAVERQQRATDRAVKIARNAIAAMPELAAAHRSEALSRGDVDPVTHDIEDDDTAAAGERRSPANENESHLEPYDR